MTILITKTNKEQNRKELGQKLYSIKLWWFEVRHFTEIRDFVFLIPRFKFKKGAIKQNTRKNNKLSSNKSNKLSENNTKFCIKTPQISIE